ncbi:protein NipSnap homolog 3A isoform X1 [Chiloscyllium plagiosum]|uniref:protein NipSnap homolog 3A isoform X1 n=1 Tax=Chiloscyllium plagiosum TaxID=36176 RepID=UPI001CB84E09|nr:protein NipSnap homolog 3A isoform X1 [Chiloscyllium plagiosum]
MYNLRNILSRIYAAAPKSLSYPSNLGQQAREKLLQVACSEARQQWCWSSGTGPAPLECKPLRSIGTSTGGNQLNGTFYEFRNYIIQPGKVADFMKLTNDFIHLRTAHSELVGYWSVEIGCLNEVFHIWKYGSYKERSAVREALATNKDWQQNYISKMLPMLLNQTNEIVYMVPWAELGEAPKKGVYELVSYQMIPGGPVVWGKAFQKAVSAHNNVGYCTLIGVFHSEFGHLNKDFTETKIHQSDLTCTVHSLWWHEDGDQRASGRRRAHEDVRVVAAVRDSASYLVSQTNKLLLPTSFSPLK